MVVAAVVSAVEHGDDDVELGDREANDVVPHDNAMVSGGGVSGGRPAEGVVFDGDVSDFSAAKDFVTRLYCDDGEDVLCPKDVIRAVANGRPVSVELAECIHSHIACLDERQDKAIVR